MKKSAQTKHTSLKELKDPIQKVNAAENPLKIAENFKKLKVKTFGICRRVSNRNNGKGSSSQDSSQHSGHHHSSSALWIFGNSNVIYALLIVLLSWSATLSWLVFSLRNQLATTNTQFNQGKTQFQSISVEILNFSLVRLHYLDC